LAVSQVASSAVASVPALPLRHFAVPPVVWTIWKRFFLSSTGVNDYVILQMGGCIREPSWGGGAPYDGHAWVGFVGEGEIALWLLITGVSGHGISHIGVFQAGGIFGRFDLEPAVCDGWLEGLNLVAREGSARGEQLGLGFGRGHAPDTPFCRWCCWTGSLRHTHGPCSQHNPSLSSRTPHSSGHLRTSSCTPAARDLRGWWMCL
jgi:hypothetical protein